MSGRATPPSSAVVKLGRTGSHDSIPNHDDIIPGPYEFQDDTPQTYFRTLTQSVKVVSGSGVESDFDRQERIMNRRGALRWLPMHGFDNDLVYACWWLVWGGVFTTVVPVLPLVALTENILWESPQTVLSEGEHIGLYGVMIFCGFCWTLAAWIFGRAVESEAVKPLLSSVFCCSTDELLSTWVMTAGIFPGILVMAVYLHHSPDNLEWRLGLLAAILCTLLMLVFVYFFLPRERKSPYRNFISPVLTCCCLPCPAVSLKKHAQNDLLVLCWLSVWGCLVASVVTFALAINSIINKEYYEIYEYSTFCIDSLIFLVGCLYFTAGSYPASGLAAAGDAAAGAPMKAGPLVGIVSQGRASAAALEV